MKPDVLVLGGGLAGLTAALEIKRRRPELDVRVVEHRRPPHAPGAHKVGESTVEIGAHFFAEQLGLREHLERAQLHKFGLRFFFGGPEPGDDLSRYDEIGPSASLPVATYQIDRGVFENFLIDHALGAGIDVRSGATIRSIEVAAAGARHRVTVRAGEAESELRPRWLIDASGRRALLRNRLSLGRPVGHANAAAWFRIAGDIDVDALGSDACWRQRCHGKPRRLSTNHFMGPGYWVWLIPLASGATSVGVVFDPAIVPMAEVGNYERVCTWIERNQPLLANVLCGRAADVLDFLRLEQYPVGSRQVFSGDGWACTGDAGMFSDPFYSPGSDFIAIANRFAAELICAPHADPEATAREYHGLFHSFFSNTLTLYRDQYAGFGDRDLMYAKSLWDYAYYWSVLAKLYFSDRMTDLAFVRSIRTELLRSAGLNARMQRRFRGVGRRRRQLPAAGTFLDHHQVGWFHELKQALVTPGEAEAKHYVANVNRLETLAVALEGVLEDSLAGRSPPPVDRLPALS